MWWYLQAVKDTLGAAYHPSSCTGGIAVWVLCNFLQWFLARAARYDKSGKLIQLYQYALISIASNCILMHFTLGSYRSSCYVWSRQCHWSNTGWSPWAHCLQARCQRASFYHGYISFARLHSLYFLTNYVDKDASVSAPVLVYPGSRLVLLSRMIFHFADCRGGWRDYHKWHASCHPSSSRKSNPNKRMSSSA